jgi:hypothetical protein
LRADSRKAAREQAKCEKQHGHDAETKNVPHVLSPPFEIKG